MEKMIRNKFWRKVRAMVVAAGAVMMVAGNCWGQNNATIKKAPNTNSVHTRTQTIYVDGSREIYIPELKINRDDSFDWYVHWYLEGKGTIEKNKVSINAIEANIRGGEFRDYKIPSDKYSAPYYTANSVLFTEKTNNGFWWAQNVRKNNDDGNPNNVDYADHATDASSVKYTLPSDYNPNDEIQIICDLSNNKEPNNWDGSTFKEPILLKRYVYKIKSAEEYVNQLSNGNIPEKYNIDFPKGCKTVNFSMASLPSNYFWGSKPYKQGERFVFSKDKDDESSYEDFYLIIKHDPNNPNSPAGASEKRVLSEQQVQQVDLSSFNKPVTYYVRAKSPSGELSPVVAQFTFNPTENSGFKFEADADADESRNPQKNGDLYQQIGVVDFDLKDVQPNCNNNISTTHLPISETVYGFLRTDKASLSNFTSVQNQYGLFRSANASNSKNLAAIGGDNNDGKKYLWIPPHMDSDLYGNSVLYDRTHEDDPNKYGFFYYIDASDDPGTIVDVEISGTLCGYTELVVVAWLSDMTRPNTTSGESSTRRPLPANVNLILKGKDVNDNEVVLHRFTSGDAITDYSSGKNTCLMKWQQLCYRITLTEDVENYHGFHLEVQNNEPHTDGADYAIDDVRIYKTLPNIEVYRNNNCDASTLIVGTDYATILRNMGWTAGEYVASDKDFYTDPDYLKYRYGLMGAEDQYRNSRVGNVYFAFLSEDKSTWMTVNDAATGLSVNAAKSLRVAVPTELSTEAYEFYTTSKDDALENEQKMNIRAVEDYNKDYEEVWSKIDGHSGGPIDVIKEVGVPGTNTFNEAKYQEALVELFARRLNIPRLRCPWYEDGILKLAIIDVDNTDLKYRGEVLDDKGTTAEGVYWVVTFSAEQVAKSGGDIDDEITIVKDGVCTLMSEFTVEPATTVLIDAVSPGNPDIAVCMGTMHQITAYLNFYDDETGDAIEDNDPAIANLNYIFDWYLGPMGDKEEEGSYKWITAQYGFSIKNALDAYRKSNNNELSDISDTDLENWDLSKVPADLGWNQEQLTKMKALLKQLLADQKLLLGKAANEPFDMPINTERMVAMPYLPKTTVENIDYDFCSTETEVNLEAVAPDNPEIYQGFLKVEYNDYADVALRLGQPNMDETELKLPIYKVMGMADEATHLGLALDREEGITSIGITLDVPGYPTVGKATELNIPKQQDGELSTQATLKFSLNATAKANMKEGQFYTLLIPFVQFKGETQLNSECDGVLHLPIKVVPEYLTWRGAATDKWYDDDKWYQSTKGELHLGAPAGDDANGSDDVEDAFSPLYFTNITILGDSVPSKSELQLESIGAEDEEGTLDIDDNNKIKYDLAVANSEGKITPYYIYNVDEVYFKPGATLLNQHRLTYDKAWVEFEMKPGDDYWMASPLKEVYAGDMYAPTSGGQQNTEAFTPIKYDSDKNDRWNPAFYQKAWNRSVTYADAESDGDATSTVTVEAVKSNWSVEYNNTTTPYSIGKGFYLRVEDEDAIENTVMVRLPKNDEHYTYETRVADGINNVDTKRHQKNLADLDTDGSMTLDLLTKVDNDGNHFLVGNPYMAYLKMDGDNGFLKANEGVIAPKYWTVDGKNGIVVGTPDVKWPTGSELSSGYIAPMQAFFVERKDYDPDAGPTKADETATTLEVTFNAGMTVSATEVTTSDDTKSFSAVNPVLTLTATSKQGQSRAAVVQKSDASNQYEADKDAVALLDSELDAPMAYTVAGSYAAAVNAIHDYKNVPLGVYAKDGEEVELSIEGTSQLVSPLYLYDAVTRSTTPIDGDSFTLNLTGSSHGRYFLTTDEGIKAEGDIRIYSPADGQLIIASTPSDRLKQVQVYDLNGRMVESRQNVGTATCQLYVPGGIYIVRVQSEQGEAQAKLKIK